MRGLYLIAAGLSVAGAAVDIASIVRTEKCKEHFDIGHCCDGKSKTNCKPTTAWYYDSEEEVCAVFQYHGCGGNKNRFATEVACKATCDEDALLQRDYNEANRGESAGYEEALVRVRRNFQTVQQAQIRRRATPSVTQNDGEEITRIITSISDAVKKAQNVEGFSDTIVEEMRNAMYGKTGTLKEAAEIIENKALNMAYTPLASRLNVELDKVKEKIENAKLAEGTAKATRAALTSLVDIIKAYPAEAGKTAELIVM